MIESLNNLGQVLLSIFAVALIAALVLLALVYRSLKRINVPPDADFFTTIRAVPISLVIALDLLDLSLDFVSTPLDWIILSHFRLTALRNVAAVEALIPFTQPIPTLTIAWIAARALNLGQPPRHKQRYVIDTDQIGPGEYAPRKETLR